MDIEVIDNNDYKIINVTAPRLDVGVAGKFKDNIASVVKQDSKVILNLSGVPFIDSTGLGTLLSFLRQLTEVGGKLKIAGLTDQVLNMFLLVRMNKVFDIYNDISEAEHEWKIQSC